MSASNLVWHDHQVTHAERVARHAQQPAVLWFTGLSGSGKSTIANALEVELLERGLYSYLLVGDNVRHGLCKDLGFSDADRVENIRRVGEVAKLFVDAGLLVLTAFISPFRADRDMVRALLPEGRFIEIFVDTDLAECERRDPKGLYKKARAGQIPNFTGIDSPYEPPEQPELVLRTAQGAPDVMAREVIDYLQQRGLLPA